VKEIRRESTPIRELEEKRSKLDANDAAGRLALARWAEQNGLIESARDLYRELLALRPDDPIARERLGHRKHEGRWMTEEEYLAATGHVRYGGKWVTKEEGERLEKDAAERRVARLEGWWLPHHPAFVYDHFLFPRGRHHQKPPATSRPQPNLRGRLRAQKGLGNAAMLQRPQ
jgi:hypothetical protein